MLVHGAVKRVRPKAITASAAFMGVLPIMWSTGVGTMVLATLLVGCSSPDSHRTLAVEQDLLQAFDRDDVVDVIVGFEDPVVSRKSSPRFSHEFTKIWSPAQSPNCNPHAERFVKTIRDECLNHLVIFGERHLRHVVKEFMVHYHRERFHQGLGGQLIEKDSASASNNRVTGKVTRRSRLGGMLNFYVREVA